MLTVKSVRWTLLTGALLLSAGCAKVGDFCDVGRPMIMDNAETPEWLFDNDPGFAVDVLSHNTFGERMCNWVAPDA